MTSVEATVQSHYTHGGLLGRIFDYLESTGIDSENLKREDLNIFDQLHARGITATQEHADHVGITADMHVLDIGSGVGGASRYLADAIKCKVTGIDLTQEFVDVARELTTRCGLSDGIEYDQANALDMPFEDETFDHAWCHNVTMNIEDKTGLAREIARVLKPGGKFSCSEIELGPTGDPIFPLPWAIEPSSSFLVTPEQMKAVLESGGLQVVQQIDLNELNLAFMREMKARAERGDPPLQANHIVMGDEFPSRLQNAAKCAVEGRTVEQLIIAEKV